MSRSDYIGDSTVLVTHIYTDVLENATPSTATINRWASALDQAGQPGQAASKGAVIEQLINTICTYTAPESGHGCCGECASFARPSGVSR